MNSETMPESVDNTSELLLSEFILIIRSADAFLKSVAILFILAIFSSPVYPQWIRQTNGIQPGEIIGYSIDACDKNTAVFAAGAYLYKTENGGTNWQNISITSFSGSASNISILDKLHLWICTDGGEIIATSDGGKSWYVQFNDTSKTTFMDYIKMFDSNTGIAMGDTKVIPAPDSVPGPVIFLKTTDGGKSWISVNDSAFGGYSGDIWRRVDFLNVDTGYFFESGIAPQKLYKTNDGCKTWHTANFPFNGAEVIKFYNSNIGLATGIENSGKLYMCRTLNGGNSWESFLLNDNSWSNDIEFIPGNPSKVWYVNSSGLYYSQDTGRTWTEQKIYNYPLNGRDLIFADSTHGWLLCDSGKVFYTSNNGGHITDVKETANKPITLYKLEQNYPNPFNPSTTISWQIPKAGIVSLVIYDILGNEIACPVNEYQSAGSHSISFNASAIPGKQISSGVYLFRLKAGEFIGTKKFVLLK